jgi:hypothetical protein
VSAIDILNQPREIVVRDGFLIFLEHFPVWTRAKNTKIVRGATKCRQDRQTAGKENRSPFDLPKTKHRYLDFALFNTMVAEC